MLTVKKFEVIEGKQVLTYDFSNFQEETRTVTKTFNSKEEAYRFYVQECKAYVIQNFDQLRVISIKYMMQLPEYTDNLGELDPYSIYNKVYQRLQGLKLKTKSKDLSAFFVNRLSNIKHSLIEINKVCKQLNKNDAQV